MLRVVWPSVSSTVAPASGRPPPDTVPVIEASARRSCTDTSGTVAGAMNPTWRVSGWYPSSENVTVYIPGVGTSATV